jgi:branched-chain amino acid transport system ATP-binding protein
VSVADRGGLEVRDVGLRFGGVQAIAALTFSVSPGELFAVIGPNGAGKTSLFNVLTGVYRPQSGSARLDGRELIGRPPAAIRRMGVARTFQNLGLFEGLSVLDNVLLGRHVRMRGGVVAGMLWWGTAKSEERAARARCRDIIDLLDLGAIVQQPVASLPYGVRKRVELARALVMEPSLLLLDEPVAGLNHSETEEVARQVLVAQKEFGLTVVMVEHDMRLVMDLADRILVLDFGQPIAIGSPDQIQRDERVLAAYLGTSGDRAVPPPSSLPTPAADVLIGRGAR